MTDHIQIGDVSPRIQYVANGAQAQFTYPFPIFAAADLEVYLDQAKQGAGFTVTGAGATAGGSVAFAAAPTAGAVVTLRRKIAIKRTSDFQESGEFRAKVINDELDYQTAALQQVAEDAARAVHLSPTDVAADLTLPDKAARSGKFIACDADGTLIASGGPASGVPVSAFGATLVDDADSATARATLGLVIGTNVLAPNGDGSQLANLPLDAALASDIRSNALAIAHLNGDRLNMVQGWADPFRDETDIDAALNVNAAYVATGGGYYAPTVSGAMLVPQASGTAIGTMTAGGGLAAAFDGNNNQAFGATAEKGPVSTRQTTGKDWGAGVARIITRYKTWACNDRGYNGAGSAENITISLLGSNTNDPTTATVLHSDTFADGADAQPKDYASGIITTTAYRYHWVGVQGTSPESATLAEVEFYEGARQNMTVVSKAVVSAASAPTVGRLHVQIKDISGGSAVNADFKGHVSRDNGTTWTQGTLALAQTLADGTAAYEFDNLDISAQPSGTAPRFTFAVFNNKEIQLHGAVVQWK